MADIAQTSANLSRVAAPSPPPASAAITTPADEADAADEEPALEEPAPEELAEPVLDESEFLDFATAARSLGITPEPAASPASEPPAVPADPMADAVESLAQAASMPGPAADPIAQAPNEPVKSVASPEAAPEPASEGGPSIDDVLADAAAELAAVSVTDVRTAADPATDAPPEALAPKAKPIAVTEDDFAAPESVAPPQPEAVAIAATVPAAAPPAPAPSSDDRRLADLETRANQPPVADIEALDKALAANAERSVAEAAAQPPVPKPEPKVDPTPDPSPVEPSAKQGVSPTPAAIVAAATTPSPASPATPEPVPAAVPVERKPLSERIGAVTHPIAGVLGKAVAPIVQLHAKMPEGTRQTVGFLALMQVFAAAVVWGWVLTPKLEKDVRVDTAGVYQSDAEAHEAEEKAKAERAARAEAHKAEQAKADEHAAGGHGSGHGAKDDHGKSGAKKDDHGGGGDAHGKKDDKKKADAHGKPAEKKSASSKKKKDAKADAHGGH